MLRIKNCLNLPVSRSTMHCNQRLLSLLMLSCAWLAIMTITSSSLSAQNMTPEFIESSSPLPNGGRVISRASAGSAMRTVTTESSTVGGTNRSSLDRGVNSVLDRQDNSIASSSDSAVTTDGSGDRNSLFRQPGAGAGVSSAETDQQPTLRYSYPAGNRVAANSNFGSAVAANTLANRVAQAVPAGQSGVLNQPVRASVGCTNCQVPYQINTLGLSSTQTTRRPQQQVFTPPNQCCGQNIYNAASSLAVPAFQQPVLQLQQPAASQVPSLSLQNSNLATQFGGIAPQGGVFGTGTGLGLPQFQPQQNRWWTPFVTGSGVYQPIVRLANLRPGTYLGQGIIGQPTAYVDGQPIRNLFRYVLP